MKIGDKVLVKDGINSKTGKSVEHPAKVVNIDRELRRFKVHYLGWRKSYDVEFDFDTTEVVFSNAPEPVMIEPRFKPEEKIIALFRKDGQRYAGVIKKADANPVTPMYVVRFYDGVRQSKTPETDISPYSEEEAQKGIEYANEQYNKPHVNKLKLLNPEDLTEEDYNQKRTTRRGGSSNTSPVSSTSRSRGSSRASRSQRSAKPSPANSRKPSLTEMTPEPEVETPAVKDKTPERTVKKTPAKSNSKSRSKTPVKTQTPASPKKAAKRELERPASPVSEILDLTTEDSENDSKKKEDENARGRSKTRKSTTTSKPASISPKKIDSPKKNKNDAVIVKEDSPKTPKRTLRSAIPEAAEPEPEEMTVESPAKSRKIEESASRRSSPRKAGKIEENHSVNEPKKPEEEKSILTNVKKETRRVSRRSVGNAPPLIKSASAPAIGRARSTRQALPAPLLPALPLGKGKSLLSPTSSIDSSPSPSRRSKRIPTGAELLQTLLGADGYGKKVRIFSMGGWYQAKIIAPPRNKKGELTVEDRKSTHLYVHFCNWPQRFDDWFECTPEFVQYEPVVEEAPVKHTFKIGDRVLAEWKAQKNSEGRWFAATVVGLPPRHYEVLFDDQVKSTVTFDRVKAMSAKEEKIANKTLANFFKELSGELPVPIEETLEDLDPESKPVRQRRSIYGSPTKRQASPIVSPNVTQRKRAKTDSVVDENEETPAPVKPADVQEDEEVPAPKNLRSKATEQKTEEKEVKNVPKALATRTVAQKEAKENSKEEQKVTEIEDSSSSLSVDLTVEKEKPQRGRSRLAKELEQIRIKAEREGVDLEKNSSRRKTSRRASVSAMRSPSPARSKRSASPALSIGSNDSGTIKTRTQEKVPITLPDYDLGDLLWCRWTDCRVYGGVVISVNEKNYSVRFALDGLEFKIPFPQVEGYWQPELRPQEDFHFFYKNLYKEKDDQRVKSALIAAKAKYESLNPPKKSKKNAKDAKKEAVETTPAPKTNAPKLKPTATKPPTKLTSKSTKDKSLGSLVQRLAKKKEEEEGALLPIAEAPAKEQAAPVSGQKKSRKTSKPSRLSQEPVIQKPLSLLEKAERAAELPKKELEEGKEVPKEKEAVAKEKKTPVEESFAVGNTKTIANTRDVESSMNITVDKDEDQDTPAQSQTSTDSQTNPEEKLPPSPAKSPVRRSRRVREKSQTESETAASPARAPSPEKPVAALPRSKSPAAVSTEERSITSPKKITSPARARVTLKAEPESPTKTVLPPDTKEIIREIPASPEKPLSPAARGRSSSPAKARSPARNQKQHTSPARAKSPAQATPADLKSPGRPAKLQKQKSPARAAAPKLAESASAPVQPQEEAAKTGDDIIATRTRRRTNTVTSLSPSRSPAVKGRKRKNSEAKAETRVSKLRKTSISAQPSPSSSPIQEAPTFDASEMVKDLLFDLLGQVIKKSNAKTYRLKAKEKREALAKALKNKKDQELTLASGPTRHHCPVNDCEKSFRKETGLASHLRHYHKDYLRENYAEEFGSTDDESAMEAASAESADEGEESWAPAPAVENEQTEQTGAILAPAIPEPPQEVKDPEYRTLPTTGSLHDIVIPEFPDDIFNEIDMTDSTLMNDSVPKTMFRCTCGWEGDHEFYQSDYYKGHNKRIYRRHCCKRPRAARNLKSTHQLKEKNRMIDHGDYFDGLKSSYWTNESVVEICKMLNQGINAEFNGRKKRDGMVDEIKNDLATQELPPGISMEDYKQFVDKLYKHERELASPHPSSADESSSLVEATPSSKGDPKEKRDSSKKAVTDSVSSPNCLLAFDNPYQDIDDRTVNWLSSNPNDTSSDFIQYSAEPRDPENEPCPVVYEDPTRIYLNSAPSNPPEQPPPVKDAAQELQELFDKAGVTVVPNDQPSEIDRPGPSGIKEMKMLPASEVPPTNRPLPVYVINQNTGTIKEKKVQEKENAQFDPSMIAGPSGLNQMGTLPSAEKQDKPFSLDDIVMEVLQPVTPSSVTSSMCNYDDGNSTSDPAWKTEKILKKEKKEKKKKSERKERRKLQKLENVDLSKYDQQSAAILENFKEKKVSLDRTIEQVKKDDERSKGLNETVELIKFHHTQRPKPKVEEPKKVKERKPKEKKKKKQPKPEETFSSLFGETLMAPSKKRKEERPRKPSKEEKLLKRFQEGQFARKPSK